MIYEGSFYYNKEGEPEVIRFDLKSKQTAAVGKLPHAQVRGEMTVMTMMIVICEMTVMQMMTLMTMMIEASRAEPANERTDERAAHYLRPDSWLF